MFGNITNQQKQNMLSNAMIVDCNKIVEKFNIACTLASINASKIDPYDNENLRQHIVGFSEQDVEIIIGPIIMKPILTNTEDYEKLVDACNTISSVITNCYRRIIANVVVGKGDASMNDDINTEEVEKVQSKIIYDDFYVNHIKSKEAEEKEKKIDEDLKNFDINNYIK